MTFVTAQVRGAYKVEDVRVYANSDGMPRFHAQGWRPMKFPKGDFHRPRAARLVRTLSSSHSFS